MLIEEGFNPLAKLEIVLVFGLYKFVDVDVTLDAIFIECVLEDLVVFNEFVLMFGAPLHSCKRKSIRVQTVHNPAVNSPSRTLFNFLDSQLYSGKGCSVSVVSLLKHLQRGVRLPTE